MARLPNLTDREQVPEALREVYDRVAGQRQGAVSGPYGVLLHSPELAERAAALSNYLRWNSVLTARQTEVAVLTVARELDAEVMWAGHVRLGREAGVSDATVEVIGSRGELAELESDEEREVVAYVRELFRANRIGQATFDALHARLGDQGIVDLTGLIGYYAFVGSVLNAFEIEPGPGAAPLPGA
jgi:4-carboxymuconolactone decarboxylase